MSDKYTPFINFSVIDLFSNGSIYDHIGGSAYSPPPPPVPASNLLLESGFRILLENGDYIALES